MMDLIKKFFTKESGATAEKRPEGSKPDDELRIATCALLLEMAQMDGKFSDPEREYILSHLKNKFALSDKDLDELMDATRAELEGSIDLWQFTNLINQNYSLEEKIKIVEMIWELAYMDGKLDHHEDYMAHKLANLLRLNHRQLIDAKLKIIHQDEKR